MVAPTSNGRSRVEMSGRSLYRGQMSMPLGSTTGAFPHRRCLQDRQRVFRNVVLVVCCKPQDAAPAESNALRLSCFAIPLSVILTGCSFQKSTSAVVSAPSTGRTATSNAGRSLAGQSHRTLSAKESARIVTSSWVVHSGRTQIRVDSRVGFHSLE